MKILFSVGNLGFLRNFEPALRLLAERGHDVHIVAERKDSVGGVRTVDALVRDYPDRVTYGYAPSRREWLWQPLAVAMRLCLDYWRYLHPRYDESPSLRARAERQAPPLASRLRRWPLVGTARAIRLWARLVDWLERAIPAGDVAERFLAEQKPDLLLLTPLLYFGSQQVEYVRAARTLGIRTVLGVGSWDHLTTKGLIHEAPDRVIVWNEMQRQEAAELHGLDPARVTVTGAQAYDHWFVQQPSLSRAEFCATVGVLDDRPLLLYLCSSPFITPHEVPFVRRWIEAIRGSADTDLRRAAVLIRPHPQNAEQWRDFEPTAYEAVGIWPRAGANPVDREARAGYFDSMHYSVATVGVNTSALIESGIVGRPVFTVIAEEFAGQQEGTLHFQHLKNVSGGLLHVGRTMDEHLAQLAGTVRGEHDAAVKSRAFVEAFVRPFGFDVPAAGRFVETLEAEAARPAPTPVAASLSQHVRRGVLKPFALAARASTRRRQAAPEPAHPPAPGTPLRVLFAVASPEYLRYFDSTMRLLADRGHHVMLAVNWLRERKHARLRLLDDHRIDVIGVVPTRDDVWMAFARALRGTMDFVRYLDPRFANTPMLRDRMYRKALPAALKPLNRIHSLRQANVGRLLRVLQACERAVPLGTRIIDFLREQQADVVVVSPLIDMASDQVDMVRAARRAGVPSIAAIASWDNLTNKGHMRVEPDLVTVWNQHQKVEAVELHGVSADRVAITGAQLFDRWFERQPSVTRQEFCRTAGLPDDRPFVLYTGSSVFIARSEFEVPFVRKWLEAMRANGHPLLRDAAVLVRPHPFNSDSWIPADFSDLGPVAIWPRRRYTPAAEDARTSFFDSLYYCDAVVGINTSAMVEAAILRRPVLSLLTPEFEGSQEGTIHFRYLLPENGGFLRVASSVDEHLAQLVAVLQDPALTRQETERFVGTFLRPHGVSRPCTPIVADAIEGLGHAGPRPRDAGTATSYALRVVLSPLAVVAWLSTLGGGARALVRWTLHHWWDGIRRDARLALRGVRLLRRLALHVVRLLRRLVLHVVRTLRPLPFRGIRALRRLAGILRRRGYLIAKRAVVWPARWGYRALMRSWRMLRHLARVALRFGVRVPRRLVRTARFVAHHSVRMGTLTTAWMFRAWRRVLHRVMHAWRLVRYHVAVRIRRVLAHGVEAMPSNAGAHRPLRILFSMRNFWFVRIFEPVIRELAARGHHVHILADYGDKKALARDWNAAAENVADDHPNITFGWAPRNIEDDWVDLRIMTRLGLDYLRFLGPEYAGAPILGGRARTRTPALIVALAQRPFWRTRAGRSILRGVLSCIESAIPVDQDLHACVESHRADVVLVTPLVTLGSEQQDVLRSAQRLGIPTALCVGSWDHLSSKAIIRPRPDRVLVWNERQRQEAVSFHGMPPDRVEVTGAQCFDVWFDRQPKYDRDTFCRRIGLDPARRYVMYACSALFEGSPNEAAFVARWIQALRESDDPTLGEVGVLVRAHPKRGFEWDEVDLSRFANVTLWPPRAEAPFDLDQKVEYFDSLYHSAAIVGLNTSALVEGGIVGRPVHTILLPEFRDNQEGTLHFHYLLEGGLLRAAADLPSHLLELAASVASSDPAVHHNRAFVESFVRPLGLSSPATPVFADAVERVAEVRCRPRRKPIAASVLRWALFPFARRTSGTFAEKIARERRRRAEHRARESRRVQFAQERVARKELKLKERAARTEFKTSERAAEKALKEKAREERLALQARQRNERVEAARRERELLAQQNREIAERKAAEKRAAQAAIDRQRQEEAARALAEKDAELQRLREARMGVTEEKVRAKQARLRDKEQRRASDLARKAREQRRARLMALWRALGVAGRSKPGV